MTNSEICKKRAMEKISKNYQRLDGDFKKVVKFPANASVSPDGLSLLDDIEFFLAHPKFRAEMEDELFKTIQAFSLKYLREGKSR